MRILGAAALAPFGSRACFGGEDRRLPITRRLGPDTGQSA